jgi:hypothetical protein
MLVVGPSGRGHAITRERYRSASWTSSTKVGRPNSEVRRRRLCAFTERMRDGADEIDTCLEETEAGAAAGE